MEQEQGKLELRLREEKEWEEQQREEQQRKLVHLRHASLPALLLFSCLCCCGHFSYLIFSLLWLLFIHLLH